MSDTLDSSKPNVIQEVEIEDRSIRQRIDDAIKANVNFTSSDFMACDKYVTTVLEYADALPAGWLDPNFATVKDYQKRFKTNLSKTASLGWNIVLMTSTNRYLVIDGQVLGTDPTPHMGLIKKEKNLILYHYTHGIVNVQNFKDESDFLKKMPFEVYVYDTAEYLGLE